MARNIDHDLLTKPRGDCAARQRFVLALKRSLEQLRPSIGKYYQSTLNVDTNSPETAEEIYAKLYQSPPYQVLCTIRRDAQELMWQSIADPIEAAAETLSEKFSRYSGNPQHGSLSLDETVSIPATMKEIHVHLQPGGYARNEHDTDVLAGAFYEAGGALYSQGQSVGTKESKAETIIRHMRETNRDLSPSRILDIACFRRLLVVTLCPYVS